MARGSLAQRHALISQATGQPSKGLGGPDELLVHRAGIAHLHAAATVRAGAQIDRKRPACRGRDGPDRTPTGAGPTPRTASAFDDGTWPENRVVQAAGNPIGERLRSEERRVGKWGRSRWAEGEWRRKRRAA